MKSEFQDKFKALFQELGDGSVLRGSALLIEFLEEPEVTTASGIVLGVDSNQKIGSVEANRPKIGLVLAVGEGYYDSETKEDIPLDVPVGAVVMLPQYSERELSTFPALAGLTRNKIALVNEQEVNFYYKDLETYQKARQILNGNN